MVVITGGEPTTHNIEPLVYKLKDAGFKIHLETNGTQRIYYSLLQWVTVSPKVEAPLAEQRFTYDEAKWLIPEWPANKIDWGLAKHDFLQPVWDDNYEKNLNLCLDMLKDHTQARLSLQIQKLIGVK